MMNNGDEFLAQLAALNGSNFPQISEEALYENAPQQLVAPQQIVPQQQLVPQQSVIPASQAIAQKIASSPIGQYIGKVGDQYIEDKRQTRGVNDSVLQMLSDRFKPNMEDVYRANLTAALPSYYKTPLSPEDVAAQRMKNELAPYTTMLGLQKQIADTEYKRAEANRNPGGTMGALVDRALVDPAFRKELYAQQTGYRQGTMLGEGGNVLPMPGAPAARGEIKQGEATGTATGKAMVKGQFNLPLMARKITSFEDNKSIVDNAILNAANLAQGRTTTGLIGSIAGAIPGTSAHDLKRTIDTLKANAGFDKLQEIRDSSPTGGALGQVSDTEERLLSASIASLENSQTKEQFIRNLGIVKMRYERVLSRLKEAYDIDTQRFGSAQAGLPEGYRQLPSGTRYRVVQ